MYTATRPLVAGTTDDSAENLSCSLFMYIRFYSHVCAVFYFCFCSVVVL